MAVVLLAPVAALAAPGSAPAAAWTKLGRDTNTVVPVPSIALDGANVVAAWAVPAPGESSGVQAATVTPALTASGRAPQVVDIVAGWSSVDSPVLLGKPGGGLQVMLSGFHSLITGDPLNGISFAPRSPDGTWGPPVASGTGSGSTAILAGDGTTPLFATTSSGAFRLYRGAVSPSVVDVAAAVGPNDEDQIPRLGRDGAGRYWLAWYGGGQAPRPSGLYLVQIDPATGGVAGAPALAPASSGIANVNLAIALACGPQDCRLVYHQTGANGTDTNRILTWAPGDAAPTPALTSVDAGANLAAAYRGDGRLWIAWYDRSGNGAYRATLGDAHGRGGVTQSLGLPPHGQDHSPGAISAVDAGGNLAIVTNFESGGVYNAWFTVASATATGTAADTSGIPNPQVIRRGPATYVIPRKPSLASLRKAKCVNVRVQTTKPAAIRVAIFSGRRSIRVFGATLVRFAAPGKRTVCVRVPLRAHTFDVRQPFRFAFALKLGAHPGKSTPATLTTSGFVNFG